MLARIVNEQGRAQIGKGWGGAQNADCSGFTVAQLQTLNFAAMDLSEFYASLVPTLPNVNALQAGSASRVPTCYYGQGSANEGHHRSGRRRMRLDRQRCLAQERLPVRDAGS